MPSTATVRRLGLSRVVGGMLRTAVERMRLDRLRETELCAPQPDLADGRDLPAVGDPEQSCDDAQRDRARGHNDAQLGESSACVKGDADLHGVRIAGSVSRTHARWGDGFSAGFPASSGPLKSLLKRVSRPPRGAPAR